MSDEAIRAFVRTAMAGDDIPRRRAADGRERWTDERLDMLERMVGPAVGVAAAHAAEIGAIRDSLELHAVMLRERMDGQDEYLRRIDAATKATNGSVAEAKRDIAMLQQINAREEGQREVLARRLAARAWIKPSVAAVAGSLLTVLLAKALGAG